MSNSEDYVSLTSLNIKRGVIKRKLSYIEKFLNEYKPEQKCQINNRIETLKGLYGEFFEVQYEIEQVEASEKKESSQEQAEEFDSKYNTLLAKLQILLIDEQAHSPTISASQDIQVKLPTINLPLFSGSYTEWSSFFDTFQALIHSNERLSDIQKYHYLKSCLKDSARQIIECLPVSASSYAVAWVTLQNRFNNKRLIAQEHINAIIHVSPVEKNSHTSLRKLSDTVQVNIQSLSKLQIDTDNWGPLLIAMLTEKLDFFTKKEWQSNLTAELPTLDEFLTFLEKRCQLLESLIATDKGTGTHTNRQSIYNKGTPSKASYTYKQGTSYATVGVSHASCTLCKQNHPLYKCEQFLNLSTNDRIELVKSKKLCFNCFKQSHHNKDCRLSGCRDCGKRHNSLLHIPSDSSTRFTNNEEQDEQLIKNAPASATVNAINVCTTSTLLPTAVVNVFNNNGRPQKLRMLLDSASQLNLITKNAAKILNLPTREETVSIIGINQSVKSINKAASWTIQSSISNFKLQMHGYVIENISTNLPAFDVDLVNLHIPDGIQLADSKFHEATSVDILAGASTFWLLLESGKIELGHKRPILQASKLGFIVSGLVPPLPSPSGKAQREYTCNFTSTINSLEHEVAKFWELDGQLCHKPLSAEEQECENVYTNTHSRADSGNYLVKLPMRKDLESLGSSYNMAIKRFKALEAKFKREPTFKRDYQQVMTEYIKLGHIEKVPRDEVYKKDNVFWLPHHAVRKTDSATTPLRIVFDGSCKSTSGTSLNDHLLVGPKLQDDLFAIIARFRTHKIPLIADVEKMYFQIEVHPEHRDFQRVLWRMNENEQIQSYRLRKVTFGTSSAPYLAVKTLHQLADDEVQNFPKAHSIIKRDFYMDDLLTGANSIEEAIQLKSELINCLKKGGFNLRRWFSISEELLDNKGIQPDIQLTKEQTSKALGIRWNNNMDSFFYFIELKEELMTDSFQHTKRSILSTIARLFDPLGWINPVLVSAKIILQKLWTLQLDWDETIPHELNEQWKQFLMNLNHINEINIPRRVIAIDNPEIYELHAFCDSSQKAYGAAIYIRAIKKPQVSMRLLCAKSRVAPIKTVALARLELCGAVLLVRLLKAVTQTINMEFASIFCWTDSSIVINWIAKSANTWETFVANRVSEIQDTTTASNWHYIPSKLNPCDVLSRGCTAQDLQNDELWSNGPNFLRNLEDDWPKLPQAKTLVTQVNNEISRAPQTEEWNILNKFSSFSKLVRIVAYCKRFVQNLKEKSRNCNALTTEEHQHAKSIIFKHTQIKHFSKELKALEKGREIAHDSKLAMLHPFLDQNGIIRLGGRLANSTLPYATKFPIVLPKDSQITRTIINETHINYLHAGPQATLNALRENYWPLGGRGLVRQVLHKCVTCFKVKPVTCTELMGNLPRNRIIASRPFTNTGIDYAGPILIKDGRGRSKKLVKAYIALFICLASKAIHLELVSDCTSESFIGALKRFISRRGKPDSLLSDNATNFKGADRELQKIMHSSTSKTYINSLSQQSIRFSFIPPRSPHFGGIYEAGIKSIKFHLKRVIGNSHLTYEEMNTTLTLIEACLNSRPITPLSSSPELEALTPGHFLIGAPLMASPEHELTDVNINRLSRWQRVEQLRQHFWKRWTREYLIQLQQRSKWRTRSKQQLKIGTLVLVQEDNLPPLQWALGKIVQLHPGADGVVRVISVRLKNCVIKRAVRRICPLPIDDNVLAN